MRSKRNYEVFVTLNSLSKAVIKIENQQYPLGGLFNFNVSMIVNNEQIKLDFENASFVQGLAGSPEDFKSIYQLRDKFRGALSELEKAVQEPIKNALNENKFPVELRIKFQYKNGIDHKQKNRQKYASMRRYNNRVAR